MSATGTCTVTPGIVFNPSTTVTPDELNLLGKPTVQLDEGSVGEAHLVKAEVVSMLGSGASGYNYLDNGNFAENRWSRGNTAVTCPTTAKTLRADEWWCTPAGAAITYERLLAGPDALSLHSAKLTGATSTTTVDFGQDIPRRIGAALQRTLLFSFWLYNGTGASFTPTVRVNTANAADDFTAATNRLSTTPATAAGNAVWTKYEVSLDGASVSGFDTGVQIVIRIPSGALSDAAKSVRIAQCKLETTDQTTASPFVVMREEAEATSDSTAVAVNLLANGQVDRFLRGGTTAVALAAGVDTFAAAGYFVNAAGASTGTAGLSTGAPPNNLTGQSLRVTGGAGVNAVKIGQRIEPEQAAKLRRNVILSVWVKYHDGAAGSTTPTLTLATCDARNDWSNVTARVTATLEACADDVWTQLSYSFDGTAVTNLLNGAELYLQVTSGDLDAGTKYIESAQWLLEEGVQASALTPAPEREVPPAVVGAARNLLCKTTSTTVVSVTADEVVLRADDGRALTVFSVDVTADMGVTGAGGLSTGSPATSTWYHTFLVSNGLEVKAIFDVSATAPTLPAGYRWKALVSTVYRNAVPALVSYFQRDRRIWQAVQATTGALATSFATAAISSFVPLIAKSFFGTVGTTGAADTRVCMSADGTASGFQVTICCAQVSAFNNFTGAGYFELPLIVAQQYWTKAATAVSYRVEVAGYTI